MKAKIFVVLFAVLLAAGSISFAGDQKPYKGWAQAIGDPDYTVNPLSYPYLAEVIAERGWPLWSQLQVFHGVNNVGGASIHENVQIFYWDFVSPTIYFYEDETITVANGDQIHLTVEGTSDVSTGLFTSIDTVVGGTGRFEGAEGSMVVTPGIIRDGVFVAVFDGYITTVGKAKKK